jgi:hypothetical protein
MAATRNPSAAHARNNAARIGRGRMVRAGVVIGFPGMRQSLPGARHWGRRRIVYPSELTSSR